MRKQRFEESFLSSGDYIDKNRRDLIMESWEESLPNDTWKSVEFKGFTKLKSGKSYGGYRVYPHVGLDHVEFWSFDGGRKNTFAISHSYEVTKPQIIDYRYYDISFYRKEFYLDLIGEVLGKDYSWYYPHNTAMIVWGTEEVMTKIKPTIDKFKEITDTKIAKGGFGRL